jgi:uncharacterized RDD family membrane protein YckC
VGGYAVDWVLFFILAVISNLSSNSGLRTILSLINLAAFIFFAVQVGQTGQTPGMRMLGLKCVKKDTGQPIGAGMAIVRALAHIIDTAICFIGWLFPLWDAQRQTIADKVVGTVVIVVPKQGFSITATRS